MREALKLVLIYCYHIGRFRTGDAGGSVAGCIFSARGRL